MKIPNELLNVHRRSCAPHETGNSSSFYDPLSNLFICPKLENYQKAANNDTHGFDGPIAISNGGAVTALAQDFLRASDAIGIPYSGMSLVIGLCLYLINFPKMTFRVGAYSPNSFDVI